MKNWEFAEFRRLRTRHADGAALEVLAGKFCRNIRQIGAAGARSGRVASLRHEARHHAVEDDSVVKAALCQSFDLRDMLGGQIRPKADRDRAVLGGEDDGVLRVGGGLLGRSCIHAEQERAYQYE